MIPIRYSKIALIAMVAIYMFLVVFNNVTDYASNFSFVSHVMSMEDVFSEKMMRRADDLKNETQLQKIHIVLT